MKEHEVKLISDLLMQGWTETDIQLKYGYSSDTIMKAKEERARQAREVFDIPNFYIGACTNPAQYARLNSQLWLASLCGCTIKTFFQKICGRFRS